MKKRAFIACVMVAAMSAVAFAGPYLVVEQDPLNPIAPARIGWEFDAPFVDMSPLSIDGDFYFTNENLWDYPTPWAGGFDLGLALFNPDSDLDVLEVGFGMQVVLGPATWPDWVALEEWGIDVVTIVRPVSWLSAYALADFVYNPAGPGRWEPEFRIGVSIGREVVRDRHVVGLW